MAALKFLQKSGGSKFWGLLWELPPSSGHGFSPRLNTIGCFLAASRPFKICSLRGSSSSSVPPLGPLTTSGFATQGSPLLLPDSTTSRCGNVWPRFSVTLHPSHHGSWPVFRCTWGDWAFAVRPALPRLGTTVQIGRLYLKERALVNRTLMRWIPGCPLMGGSSSQLRSWSNVTGPMSCGRVFPRLNKPSSARNWVPCRGCPSLAPQLFRVLLLRRLWLALPLSSRTCRCGRPLDVLGHHRAACSSGSLGESGVLLGECSGTGLP